MSVRYVLRDLTLPSARLTWQGALVIALLGSALWLTAVIAARIMIHML
ncbi:hypothetical protein [Pseudooceanicola sp. MF1-13]